MKQKALLYKNMLILDYWEAHQEVHRYMMKHTKRTNFKKLFESYNWDELEKTLKSYGFNKTIIIVELDIKLKNEIEKRK